MSLLGDASRPGDFQKRVPRNLRTIFRLRNTAVDQAINDTFLDEGPNNLAISSVGTGVRGQGGFSPFSAPFGDWALQLACTAGEALHPYINTNAALTTGTTADFTFECFVMRVHYNTFNTISSISTGGAVTGRLTNSGVSIYSGAAAHTAMKPGKWVHFAINRKAGVFSLYVGGVLLKQNTGDTSNMGFAAANAYLGDYNANSNQDWCGYMSNLRIVIGSAVYDGSPTIEVPTSALTVVPNTKFLGLCGPSMLDYSGNGNTIVYGTTPPRMVPIGPFGTSDLDAYVAATHGGSYYSGGAGTYLTGPAHASNAFGTGDFTIEFWTYLHAQANNGVLAGAWTGTAGTSAWAVTQGSTATNGGVRVLLSNGSSMTSIDSTTGAQLRPYSWVHVAICRSGGTLYMFLNGIQVYSAANSINITSTTAPLAIMALAGNVSPSNGYIANLKVSNIARYTAAFTPPAAPVTSDANTTLLLNFSNPAIYDDSRKSGLYLAGNTDVVADATAPGTDPYAVAFDGTGDYIQLLNPSMNWMFGSDGEFTIEMWMNFSNASAANFYLLDFGMFSIQRSTGNKLMWVYFNAGNSSTTNRITSVATVATTGKWYHIAFVRTAGVLRLFIDGVLDSTVTDTDTLTQSATTSNVLTIGSKMDNTLGLNGKIKGFNAVRYAKYLTAFTPAGDLS